MLFVQLQQAPVADLVVAKAVQQPQAAASVAAGKVRKPRRSRRGDLPTRFSPRQQEKKQKAAEAQARICLQESGIIPQGGAPAAPEMALPQAVPQLPVEQLPADEQDMIDAEDVSLFNLQFFYHLFQLYQRVLCLSSQPFFCQQYYIHQQYYSRAILDYVSIIIKLQFWKVIKYN